MKKHLVKALKREAKAIFKGVLRELVKIANEVKRAGR